MSDIKNALGVLFLQGGDGKWSASIQEYPIIGKNQLGMPELIEFFEDMGKNLEIQGNQDLDYLIGKSFDKFRQKLKEVNNEG